MVKKYNVRVNGKSYEVEVEEMQNTSNIQNTQRHQEPLPQETFREQNPVQRTESQKPTEQPQADVAKNNGTTSSINAPMSGLVITVKVKKGDSVKAGDKLLVLEAMKMENDIVSDITGIIDEVHCKKGDNVETGESLISIV